MSKFKTNIDWPETPTVRNQWFIDVFRLRWFTSPLELEGFYNISTAPNCESNVESYLIPGYSCPGCNKILLVPFPEVENEKELHTFFENHIKDHEVKPIESTGDEPLTNEQIQLIHSGLTLPNRNAIKKMTEEIRTNRGVLNPKDI